MLNETPREAWLVELIRQSFSVGGGTGVTSATSHQNKILEFIFSNFCVFCFSK